VTLLTDNTPVYTEQAVFTPDMQDVIMMTNRQDSPTSWTKEVMSAGQTTKFDDANTGATQTLQFLADFLGKNDFTAELWIVDGPTGSAPKQLTTLGVVIPEFYWNANYTELLWTAESFSGPSSSYTAQFSGIPAASLAPPTSTPAWLIGQPVDMAVVGPAALAPTQLGSVDNISVPVLPPFNPAPAFPHGKVNNDTQSTPVVTTTYVVPWQADLTALGALTGQNLALPGLSRL
jgi:hypothetical protein